jgi:hypothetical protein
MRQGAAKRGLQVGGAWRVAALNGKRRAHLRLNHTTPELVEADAGGVGLTDAAQNGPRPTAEPIPAMRCKERRSEGPPGPARRQSSENEGGI